MLDMNGLVFVRVPEVLIDVDVPGKDDRKGVIDESM